MTALQAYRAYKDSGVEWLGEVPEHWEVRRASDRLRVTKRPIDPRKIPDNEILHYSIPNVQQHGGGETELASSLDSGKTLVDRELLLVSKLNPRKGTIALARPHPALVTIASSEFVALEPRGCLGTFARYFYASEHVRLELSSRVDSATKSHQRCTPAAIVKLQVPWPPTEEQTGIACFLDHADGRIQRYIRAKERLIELLEEQKQVIIHQVVTGQINVRTGKPYPAYKDSGVEWLGEVPEHWEVRRLRNVGKAIIGLTYAPQDVGCEEDGVLVLRASNVSENRIVDADNVFVRCSVPDHLITRVGDILICSRSGSRALIGKNARIDSASSGVTFGAFMTVFRSNYSNYCHCVFNSQVFEYQSGAFLTSTINQLTLGMLYSIKIPLPPPVQQERIIRYLEEGTGALNKVIACSRRQIALMREYRIRLIADVVTGKLDVRDASAVLADLDPLAFADTQETTPKPEANSKAVVPPTHP